MAWTERYVRADAAGGGDGTTDTNSGGNGAWTLAEGVTNHAAGMRLNVRAGTYANTTTGRTFNAAGTTTAPIWWRGFNTTPGDIDTDNSLAKPLITWTTGRLQITGAHQNVSNLSFLVTGAAGQAAIAITSGSVWMDRCRSEHQQATANGIAFSTGTAAGVILTRCWAKVTTTATSAIATAVGTEVAGCYTTGGVSGIAFTGGSSNARGCVITSPVTNGIYVNTASTNGCKIESCTIYNTVNGVNVAQVIAGHSVMDCLISTCTNGITNTSGANTNFLKLLSNSFYNVTNTVVGLGDAPVLSSVTETADPLVDPGGGDFRLVPTALSKASATPPDFENVTVTSYLDRGGVQRQEVLYFIPVE